VDENDLRSEIITRGLGGIQNIDNVDCCATRLRLTVMDPSKADKDFLKQSGASGVLTEGKGVQAIYGPKVNIVKSYLEEFLEENKDNPDLQDISDKKEAGLEVKDKAREEKKIEIK